MAEELLQGKTDIVVDGNISADKLLQLIRHNAEEDFLDYKLNYDHKDKKQKLELVRDLVSMANTQGGYIVIGVGENKEVGTGFIPVGIDEECQRGLDITKIYDQLTPFIVPRLDIRLTIYSLPELENNTFALIYVAQGTELPIIFEQDGSFQGKKRTETKFHKGDTYVRRGAASVRADQNDIRRFVSLIRRREKETWTEEILGLTDLKQRIEAVLAFFSGQAAPDLQQFRGPTFSEMMFYVDDLVFDRHILDLLEIGNTIGLTRYLEEAWPTFVANVNDNLSVDDSELERVKDNKLRPILDCLTAIAAIAVRYDRSELFSTAVDKLYEVFRHASELAFPTPQHSELHYGTTWVWEEITARVYALGALLVKMHRYTWIPVLSLRTMDTGATIYSWMRFGGVMLSRAQRLDAPSLCPLGISFIKESPLFRRLFGQNEDEIIDYTCQFDFLQGVHTLHAGLNPYPSFGAYYNYHTVPIVRELIRDTPARQAIQGISDQELAQIIDWLDEKAASAFFNFAGWDRGEWMDPSIDEFLDKNLPRQNP